MKKRTHVKQEQSLEDRLAAHADGARKAAAGLPPSEKREELLSKAREAEFSVQMARMLKRP